MAAKPSPKPRMPRAISKSVISDRCGDVPSTRNLLETPSVAQSLDGYLRLKGSLRFPDVKFRLAMRSRSSRVLLPLPACGERVGVRGPLRWAQNSVMSATLQHCPHGSESRRGPLTLARYARIADPSDRRSL